MFTVIYEFNVSPENEDEFKSVWHELTVLLKKNNGALGSRLHRSLDKEGKWIAYAEWPNRETWLSPHRTEEQMLLRARMDAISSVKTLFELEVIEDLLLLKGDSDGHNHA